MFFNLPNKSLHSVYQSAISMFRRHLPVRYYSEPNGAAIYLGKPSLPRAKNKSNATNIDQCLPR